ncbi:MAG: 1,4-dihydroxy-6-naphthoate synthase [Candidatus Sumerlaeia bacterium]|nr:1,4-dihydroxy-6-naphthoate synthase [Candidatus Sumerlaeia bacterium]
MTFLKLQLAISPCPNDTMIFGAWIQNFLPDSIPPRVEFHDIQTLNERARRGTDDVVKVSFHAAAHLLSDYALLRCGGALGRGCGPLLVSSRHYSADELSALPVAIPGELTTAALLLRLWNPQLINLVSMPFHEIMPAIVRGEVAAGAIIHESRFTFGDFGLRSLVDLGEWWESETGAPIPLGGILIRRSLGKEVALQVEKMIRSSLQYGWDHLEALQPFISLHAQEMNPEVQRQHIELYVNSFSMDYGVEGERAIRLLFEEAHRKGIIPKIQEELFLT